jgi:hypothetical protein
VPRIARRALKAPEGIINCLKPPQKELCQKPEEMLSADALKLDQDHTTIPHVFHNENSLTRAP